MSNRDSKSYALPVTIDPESYQAICVLIPDDTLYLGAFWNAYEYFTKYVAWERDALHRGTLAAQVWKIGFDQARAAWVAGERCDMGIILRQNPANDCQLQQSHDGGDTWTLAFDYSLCGGPVHVGPPLPGNPEAPAAAAGNAIRNIFIGLLDLIGDCSIGRETFISTATAYMRLADPTFGNPVALGNLYDSYCALDPGDQENAKDECTYATKHMELAACYDEGGILSDLQCLDSAIAQWILESGDATALELLSLAGSITLAGWNAFSAGPIGGGGGGGGGAGFGSQCGWCHEFDFTTDDYQTGNPVNITQYFGQYGGSTGYSTGLDHQLDIRFEFGGIYEITYMEIGYGTTGSVHHDGEYFRVNTQHGAFLGGPFSQYGGPGNEHLIHQGGGILAGGHTPTGTGFVQVQIIQAGDPGGSQVVSYWKICGTGPDPFT